MYMGNPTVGGTNGTMVSEGNGSNPVTVGPLNASTNEVSASQKLALRCESGYETVGDTTITPTGTTAAKWALSSNGSSWTGYGAPLTVTSKIGATNIIFYARARATSDESAVNDASVDLKVDAVLAAV